MSTPDRLHALLDEVVQVLSASKTGHTKRVPVRMRQLPLGTDWQDVLAQEAQGVIEENKAKNTRTAARKHRGYRTIRKGM